MVEYKWVALSNTTLGVLMASIDSTIVLISLPAIFRGINIDPLTSFQYLIWLLFGYFIVTATLLVTFGRISDMFGRVRLYNLGFAIFTAGSILLSITPNTGDLGAIELIGFRLIQAVGAGFLWSNSEAIITDAFPADERGKALGINQIAFLLGSFIGLVLGGVLAVIDWRLVFLVSVPVGIAGTIWSYAKLRELGTIRPDRKLDIGGNATFALGLTTLLIAVTYGLLPYGTAPMGWGDPWVVAGLIGGAALMVGFIFIELHVPDPMFRLEFFRNRSFATAISATFLGSVARGGVLLMLTILLQGIWLPLHGYSYDSTPFWAGIFMLPVSLGLITAGPISGWVSDRHGARTLATTGMALASATFLALTTLPYNFDYLTFGVLIYLNGLGMGMFAAPNMASIMNAVPPEHRGATAGMTRTLQNTGQLASFSMFFTVVTVAFSGTLPAALTSAVTSAGAPQLAPVLSRISPTGAMFAAFLGYNPMQTILSQLPANLTSSIPPQTIATLTGLDWFPHAIAPSFMSSLAEAFYVSAGLTSAAAVASALRGKRFVYEEDVLGVHRVAAAANGGGHDAPVAHAESGGSATNPDPPSPPGEGNHG